VKEKGFSDPMASVPSHVPGRDPTQQRRSLWRFMGYVRPYIGLCAAAALCGLMKFVLPASTAISLRFLADRLAPTASATQAGKADFTYRWTETYLNWLAHTLPASWELNTGWGRFNLLGCSLLTMYAVWAVTFYFRGYLSQLAGHRVILDLRTDLYQHITRMGHSFFQKRQSGSIMSRLMSDIALAQNFVGNAMTNIWMDLGTCLFYLLVLFSMDERLALASLVVFPFYITSMRTLGRASKRTSRAVQEALEEFSGDVHERIAGIAVVKSFAAEQREARSFFAGARGLYDLTMRNVRITMLSNTLVQWLTQMATLGLIWYGGWRVLTGQTSIGTVIAFIMLLKEMYLPINRISELNTILHNSLAAIDRVFEVFDIEPDVQESARARELPRIEGRIRFDHVTFAYNDPTRPQIRDVDLEIAPGEVVALVGPSGAGKSTLIQLIPRFYDPQQGCVRVDGWDVREVKLRSLRSQIGMVAQDTLLFSGSVRDNLLYGRPDATPGQMVEAARAAHAHDFLNALPDGYDTLLGERGAKLSGGQKQRLALARAFLCDPRILILDEATSALDSESEMLIQEALGRLMKGRTSLIIAHRLSTILNSDRIVVMDAGQVVEVGTHRQLLENHGLYARLYETQFRSAYAEESARFS
jgi:subfamily B ATP-binding cassette protein MsbA